MTDPASTEPDVPDPDASADASTPALPDALPDAPSGKTGVGDGEARAIDAPDAPAGRAEERVMEAEEQVVEAEERVLEAEEALEEVISEYEVLRRLLMAPEQTRLTEVHRRLDELGAREVQVVNVSEVLAEAVSEASAQSDSLAEALAPTIETTLRVSVERNPQPLVNAIFPVIGPAIRKSIAEALRAFLEAVNRTMEQSLSPRSLGWRLEALRTGRSFSEVVLSHTLLYRVEQLFLIDRQTGLPLHHLAADAVETQDGSVVSGMLTAIQDFVHDSFSTPGGDMIDAIEMGDVVIWIEEGPEALLAAVIRGIPAPELREKLKEMIEAIHLRFRPELEAFNGEAKPFEATTSLLEKGLLSQFQPPKPKNMMGAWLAGAALGILLGVWLFFVIRAQLRWDDFTAVLAAQPGLVIIDAQGTGEWHIHGLRDPLATDPATLLAASPLNADKVTMVWEPYQTLDPEIVARRAARLLDAPSAVAFTFADDGTLTASGIAPLDWIARARADARFLPGVLAFDDTALTPDTGALEALERATLRFRLGTPRLATGQDATLDALATDVEALFADATAAGKRIRLQILGHASAEGNPGFNQRVSQQRAEAVRDALLARNIPPDAVEAVGTGQPRVADATTEAEREANRSVSFRVVMQ